MWGHLLDMNLNLCMGLVDNRTQTSAAPALTAYSTYRDITCNTRTNLSRHIDGTLV